MKKNKSDTLDVVELFAGVGGFRIGLEGYNGKSSTSKYSKKHKSIFRTVWSNQFEPSSKIQHASNIYKIRFGESNHSNQNIQEVGVEEIPEHDLLVGGFPCQDYSVAKQLSKSEGIAGKKGVLWWDIHRIVSHHRPKFIFLENVDRLIKSPTKQRGRDFAIMLASLSDLDYIVEWRVINASDYGLPQRRRRIFIVAYKKELTTDNEPLEIIESTGIFSRSFPICQINPLLVNTFKISGDLPSITESFNFAGRKSPFENSGFVCDRVVTTVSVSPDFIGETTKLGDILLDIKEIDQEYFIRQQDLEKWKYLKGSKKEPRKKSTGEIFYYTEGPLVFPDPLDKPARTIITSEGGSTPSRFKLVVNQGGQLRRLHPIELERINMFPDNHTEGVSPTRRAFFMGNALVVGVIERIGVSIQEHYLKFRRGQIAE